MIIIINNINFFKVSFTLIIKKYSKSSVNTERLAPKYARQSPWLAFGICLILCGNFITQDLAYNAPDVNIYQSSGFDLNLSDSDDYFPLNTFDLYRLIFV